MAVEEQAWYKDQRSPRLLKLSPGGVLNGEPVQTTTDKAMAAEEQAWSARLNTAEGFPPPRT